jgi:arsenate reductase
MHATIWHNPACGTSRNTLALLQEAGAEVTVIEYLKTPPSATKLAQLYRDAGLTPQQGLRLRGTDAEERGLPQADDATVLAAMVAEPKLIERPWWKPTRACACAGPRRRWRKSLSGDCQTGGPASCPAQRATGKEKGADCSALFIRSLGSGFRRGCRRKRAVKPYCAFPKVAKFSFPTKPNLVTLDSVMSFSSRLAVS